MENEHEFNYKSFLQKRANYEGAQGYMRAQSRAWMNCTKRKMEDGTEPQEAWFSCCDEFQKGDQNMEWVSKYASEDSDKLLKTADDYQVQMAPYWEKIHQKVRLAGKTLDQAVVEVVKELRESRSK
jgi:hypothetical protein